MKNKKAGSLWIALGILLLVGAAGLSFYNFADGVRAAKASEAIAVQLAERIVLNSAAANGKLGGEGGDGDAPSESGGSGADDSADRQLYAGASQEAVAKYGKSVSLSTAVPYKEMPTEVIDGERYIGILEIPSLNLTLPVMENWNYERLKVSPCRYSGSYYSDDLVICAHNYARHFSPIKWIGIGEDVIFTNVEGLRIPYKTSNISTVEPAAVDEMTDPEGSNGGNTWDMTLFTCNTGGQTRCAVRCVRTDKL